MIRFWNQETDFDRTLIKLGYTKVWKNWHKRSELYKPTVTIPASLVKSFDSLDAYMLNIIWSPQTHKSYKLAYYLAWEDIKTATSA